MAPDVDANNGKSGNRDPVEPSIARSVTARVIAVQLGPLITEAEVAGLDMLAYLLGVARIEAEEVAKQTIATR